MDHALKIFHTYSFKELSYKQFHDLRKDVISKQVNNFQKRNKTSGWDGNEELFMKLTDNFMSNKKLIARLILKDGKISGIHLMIIEKNSVCLWFIAKLDWEDYYFTLVFYLDALERYKKMSLSYTKSFKIEAMRGAFRYKKKMGFEPKPSYALVVNDPDWQIYYNNDLSPKQTVSLYGRKFGAVQ